MELMKSLDVDVLNEELMGTEGAVKLSPGEHLLLKTIIIPPGKRLIGILSGPEKTVLHMAFDGIAIRVLGQPFKNPCEGIWVVPVTPGVRNLVDGMPDTTLLKG